MVANSVSTKSGTPSSQPKVNQQYISTKSLVTLSQPTVERLSRNTDSISSTPIITGSENSAHAPIAKNLSEANVVPTTSQSDKRHNRIRYPPLPLSLNAAKGIVARNAECCPANFNCFTKTLTLPDAANIVYSCRQELQNTESRAHLIDKLREKVNQCVYEVREGSKYLKMVYKIHPEQKSNIPMIKDPVCRNTFMEAWGINLSLMKQLRKEVKDDILKTTRKITDRYSKVTGDLDKLVESCGLAKFVNQKHLNIAKLPNSEGAHHLYCWLQNYFDLSGDQEPNCDEIHLDTVTKKAVYNEYLSESVVFGFVPLGLSTFKKIWKDCFPYVKIREYKAVSGKCYICAKLSVLSGKHRTREAMEYIKVCRVIHRADFMADRNLYQQRKKQCELYPQLYMSVITDGMQQSHCELPYSGNKVPTGVNKLKQHLQGVTTHFRRTRMYRALDHIYLGANACIYTLLCALEEAYQFYGRLPRTLYVQIDGGSENANYVFLAWMEIIIILEIGAEEIWVCRLRVGHNHADQDAKFGLLWKAARSDFLLTPQAYEDLIARIVHEGVNNPAKLIDTFVVPDLVNALDDCIDPELRNLFKTVHTQHIIRFQKVQVSSKYPLGSKLTYRASAVDEFYEFIDYHKSPIGKSPRKVIVEWQPKDNPAGLRILTRKPTALGNIRPQAFVDGAVEHMRHIISVIIETCVHPDFVKDWEVFSAKLPLVGESPDEFIERGNEFHIPFRTLLCNFDKIQPETLAAAPLSEDLGVGDYGIPLPPPVMAGACVRSQLSMKPEPPRVTVDGRHDATQPEQRLRRSTKIRWRFDPQLIVEGNTQQYRNATCFTILLKVLHCLSLHPHGKTTT